MNTKPSSHTSRSGCDPEARAPDWNVDLLRSVSALERLRFGLVAPKEIGDALATEMLKGQLRGVVVLPSLAAAPLGTASCGACSTLPHLDKTGTPA